MEMRLSSILVPIYKLIFVLAAVICIYALSRDLISMRAVGLNWAGGVIFLLGWLAIWYFVASRWKSVHLKNESLYVSNYLRTIEVPVSDVIGVEASSFWGWQPQTVTLKLKYGTVFGKDIIFVPNGGMMNAKAYAVQLRRKLALSYKVLVYWKRSYWTGL